MFVSSDTSDDSPDKFQSSCPRGYWEDSCKRADMMTIAAEYLNRPGKEVLDWIYFLDDDAYLLSDNMQRMIQTQIESGANLTDKCGSEECWGICGGG
jgi:hypothetical protein